MDTTVQINISTDNFSSEGGFVNIADSSGSFNDGISDLSGNTQLYFSFKAIPHAAKSDSNSIYTLYLENNGGVNTEKELRVNASSFGGLCLHESIPVNTPNGDKLIGEFSESGIRNIWINPTQTYFTINNKLNVTPGHVMFFRRENKYY